MARTFQRSRAGVWLSAALAVATMAAVWVGSQSGSAEISEAITVNAVPVPLNPQDLSQVAIGDFFYAGGLILTTRQTDRLHGLSDLEVTDTNRLIAVGDFGAFLEAGLVFDSAERLVDITDARLTQLAGEDGRPLSGRANVDAEGLALLPNGDRLVSFERHDRIWLYPASGGPPRPAPAPPVAFPPNGGLEALAADPDAGADAYVVGAEVTGETWTCRLSTACIKGPVIDMPGKFRFVAMKRLPEKQTAYLLTQGTGTSLQIFRAESLVARLDLAPPITWDNYEGVAAVAGRNGGIRFYLISDDNGSARQRTLLLAFDWRPRWSL
jgi:hypothetical protein